MKKVFAIAFAVLSVIKAISQDKQPVLSEDRHIFIFGVMAGAAFTDMKFTVPPSSFYSSVKNLAIAKFHTSANPVFGVYTQFNLSEKTSAHAAGIEIMYHPYSYNSDSTSILTERGVYKFSLAYWRNTLNYRYTYPVGNLYVSALAGFTFGLNLKLEDSYNYKNSSGFQSENLGIVKPANDIGFLGGLGLQYKRFGLDLRYYNSNPFTNNVNLDFKARAHSIFALMRYSIVNR